VAAYVLGAVAFAAGIFDGDEFTRKILHQFPPPGLPGLDVGALFLIMVFSGFLFPSAGTVFVFFAIYRWSPKSAIKWWVALGVALLLIFLLGFYLAYASITRVVPAAPRDSLVIVKGQLA
jgi:hypothetical protein